MARRASSRQRGWVAVGGLLCLTLAWSGTTLAASKSKAPPPRKEAKSELAVTGPVSFNNDQGNILYGLYFAGKPGGPGVVMVHMDGRSSEDWRHFAEKLVKTGFHALALDLRGHGQSTRLTNGKTLTYDQLDEAQYQAMTHDVAAAVNFLRTKTNVNPAQISLIGASVGANLAIRYAADDPRITNVVLLSPGLDYKGVTAEEAVQRYGERPLFIAVSREDNFSAKSSLVLNSMARGKKYFQPYTGAGHGTKMMIREPGLETLMTSWLNGTLVSDIDDDADADAPPPTRR